MALIGLGVGGVMGPLTMKAVSGVADNDAGAASGLINVFHHLGGAVGLSILVVVSAAADTPRLAPKAQLAHRIGAALYGGAVLLTAALLIATVLLVQSQRRPSTTPDNRPRPERSPPAPSLS
jgi:hypothetical protein